MADQPTSIHGQWTTRTVFILAATGSAVGLGNIWKFPYITGENGGGTFVIVYLLCIGLIGLPIMIAEIMLGRRGKQSPINTMMTLARDEHRSPAWAWLGWMGGSRGFSYSFLLQCDCRLGNVVYLPHCRRDVSWGYQ